MAARTCPVPFGLLACAVLVAAVLVTGAIGHHTGAPHDEPANSSSSSPTPAVSTTAAGAANSGGGAAAAATTSAPSVTTATSSSSSSSCFPASAVVSTPAGSVRMSELSVGDRVLASADGTYSPVFMFTHKISPVLLPLQQARFPFVKLGTQSGLSLTLSPGHFLYVNGQLAPAARVSVGDVLETARGSADPVVSTETVTEAGLYNPQTVHGDIIVNGVRASTYTTAVEPSIAHAALSPLRALYSAFGVYSSALEQGADSIAALLPAALRGQQ